MPPLRCGSGIDGDHRRVYIEALVKPPRNFKWVSNMKRTRDRGREEAFAEEMTNWDWSGREGGVESMTTTLSEVIVSLTEKHFPLVRVRKRSNESPWITRRIRKLWRRKI